MKQKIILINSMAGVGGAERQVSRIAKSLDIDKVVILENEFGFEIEGGDVPIISLTKHTRKTSKALKLFYLPIYALKLGKVVKKGDVVVSFLERANFVNVIAKWFFKTRVIVSARVNPSALFKKGLLKINLFLIKFFYSKADLIIANSYGTKNDLEKNFGINPQQIKVIYNAFNAEKIRALSEERLESGLEKIFSFPVIMTSMTRLDSQKGHWHIVRVFKKIKAEMSDVKLVIIGDGSLREYLIKLSKDLGLKTYSVWENNELKQDYDVYFLGVCENPFKFLSKADVFVSASLAEGFPNALVEAMICGVPVISSDCPSGPREILAPKTDVVFQTEKPDYADFGILMPMFSGVKYGSVDLLEKSEELWALVLPEVLKNKAIKEKYSLAGKKRAKDFESEKIIEGWKKIIKNYE